jgi:hypothetical protein
MIQEGSAKVDKLPEEKVIQLLAGNAFQHFKTGQHRLKKCIRCYWGRYKEKVQFKFSLTSCRPGVEVSSEQGVFAENGQI